MEDEVRKLSFLAGPVLQLSGTFLDAFLNRSGPNPDPFPRQDGDFSAHSGSFQLQLQQALSKSPPIKDAPDHRPLSGEPGPPRSTQDSVERPRPRDEAVGSNREVAAKEAGDSQRGNQASSGAPQSTQSSTEPPSEPKTEETQAEPADFSLAFFQANQNRVFVAIPPGDSQTSTPAGPTNNLAGQPSPLALPGVLAANSPIPGNPGNPSGLANAVQPIDPAPLAAGSPPQVGVGFSVKGLETQVGATLDPALDSNQGGDSVPVSAGLAPVSNKGVSPLSQANHHPIPTMGIHELSQKVALEAARVGPQGQSEIIMRLDPPELGTVRVKILHDGQGLRIEVTGQQAQSVELLQSQMDSLRQRLESAGIEPKGLVIRYESEPGPGNQHRHGNQEGWEPVDSASIGLGLRKAGAPFRLVSVAGHLESYFDSGIDFVA